MTDILLHFQWHTAEQAKEDLKARVLPWIGEQLGRGCGLSGAIGEYEADITLKQRAFLHGVVLTEIAQYARPGDQQFPMPVWKEHFRAEFLGFKVVTSINPLTGRKHRRRQRVSTEDLGIRAMAEYIDRIIAYAATELGVEVSEPLPPELRGKRKRDRAPVDQDTGEVMVPA